MQNISYIYVLDNTSILNIFTSQTLAIVWGLSIYFKEDMFKNISICLKHIVQFSSCTFPLIGSC